MSEFSLNFIFTLLMKLMKINIDTKNLPNSNYIFFIKKNSNINQLSNFWY